eukprot:COSAG01_NODE_2866_length_6949_cov_4.994599_8_plen_93_part_00
MTLTQLQRTCRDTWLEETGSRRALVDRLTENDAPPGGWREAGARARGSGGGGGGGGGGGADRRRRERTLRAKCDTSAWLMRRARWLPATAPQ